jgi:5-methylcytosine-specific restriction endonuclease McrA
MNKAGLYRRSVKGYLYSYWLGKCAYCDVKLDKSEATIDHFIALADGGKEHVSNYVLSCKSCNHKKGRKTPKQWLYYSYDKWASIRDKLEYAAPDVDLSTTPADGPNP